MGQNARTIAERSSFADVYAERHTTASEKARMGVFKDAKKKPSLYTSAPMPPAPPPQAELRLARKMIDTVLLLLDSTCST